MNKPHYIAGSGSYGCLYDCCTVHDSAHDARAELAQRFERASLPRALRQNGDFADLPAGAGADYCEVVECTCDNPSQHEDA